MTPADRAAGYDHRLAQLEVSLTDVFDRPVPGRHFFEALIRENLDLGRPDRVGLLFPFRIRRTTPPPTFGYRTRVITDGVQPSLHVEYKHSHVKQYFKEQHALRTETTINNPNVGRPCTCTQMTYDLRRLRLKGVIHRIPKTHRYIATTHGLEVAFFYSKLYLRILRPQWNALLPDSDHLPRPLRTALDQLDAEIQKLHQEASLAA